MTLFILDCADAGTKSDAATCTLSNYTPPPATVTEYALAPTWGIVVAAVVIIAFLIATAIVRYKAHEERNETERARINKPPATRCPTCGWTEALSDA